MLRSGNKLLDPCHRLNFAAELTLGHVWLRAIQHVGMYTGFIFFAFMGIGREREFQGIPPNADYAAFILGLSVQWMLVVLHTSRWPLEEMVGQAALSYFTKGGFHAHIFRTKNSMHVLLNLY